MIKPLGNRVLIKPNPVEESTKSGIVLSKETINPPFFVGTVLEVNKAVTSVKKGDKVAHLKYGMDILETPDGEVYLVEESSLIALYE